MGKNPPKLLLADDESHIRTMMKAVVKTMGYELVGEAANGLEAVDRFRSLRPDITLLDINMPIKTGLEALKEIMTLDPSACVIMLTSLSDRETIEECLALGASNYIRKDTPLAQIKALIAETWEDCQEE